MTNTHKCADCDRQIPVDFPRCIYCKSAKRKAGICWWCGERPVSVKKESQPSQYCVSCKDNKGRKQVMAAALDSPTERTLSRRGSEQTGRPARPSTLLGGQAEMNSFDDS